MKNLKAIELTYSALTLFFLLLFSPIEANSYSLVTSMAYAEKTSPVEKKKERKLKKRYNKNKVKKYKSTKHKTKAIIFLILGFIFSALAFVCLLLLWLALWDGILFLAIIIIFGILGFILSSIFSFIGAKKNFKLFNFSKPKKEEKLLILLDKKKAILFNLINQKKKLENKLLENRKKKKPTYPIYSKLKECSESIVKIRSQIEKIENKINSSNYKN